MDIVRWTLYVGHCTLDIVRWTSYVGHCTFDIVLILATYPVVALDVTVRNQNEKLTFPNFNMLTLGDFG